MKEQTRHIIHVSIWVTLFLVIIFQSLVLWDQSQQRDDLAQHYTDSVADVSALRFELGRYMAENERLRAKIDTLNQRMEFTVQALEKSNERPCKR